MPRSVLLGFSILSYYPFHLGFMTKAMSNLVFRPKINLGFAVVNEGREGKT